MVAVADAGTCVGEGVFWIGSFALEIQADNTRAINPGSTVAAAHFM
jgi:hypothetical protein